MAQRILGLDLGARAVKAVVVEGTHRGFTVSAAREVAVAPPVEGAAPATPLERQLEAAREALVGLAFDAAVVALPGASASHHVTLPFEDPRRIEQTVGFEVESQIPFDLADVAWDWQPARTGDGKSELLVGVVRKADLAQLLSGLAAVGVDPRAVVPPGLAYASLLEPSVLEARAWADVPASEPEAAPANVATGVGDAEAVVDAGATRTSVCVVAGGTCQAARTFLTPPGGAVPLAREVRATLRAWRGRSPGGAPPVRRILLAGGAAELPGLAEALAAEAGAVEPLALAPGLAAVIPAADAPRFALALALALRGGLGSRAPRLNLRRGDLAYTRDFQHLRGKVLRLGAWVALLLVLALASASVRAFALSRQEALLDRALCDATRKLVGRCYEDFDTAVSVLRGKGTAAAAIPRDSALDVFVELAARTPADVALRYDRIEITRDKLHLQGTTDAAENVDRVVSGLRASRCFGDARSGGARRRTSDGKFEFTVDSDLTCDTGEKPAAKG